VDKLILDLIGRIAKNHSLVREQHPVLKPEARYFVITQSQELYERILNNYPYHIYGMQIGGKYKERKGRKPIPNFLISHLVWEKLQPILDEAGLEHITGEVEERELVFAE
jgi:hypothetical protein